MRYSNAIALHAKPAMFQTLIEENLNLGKKIRSYTAPVVATLILGGLLVGNIALRCYPYWS